MKYGWRDFSRSAVAAVIALQASPLVADTGSGRQIAPVTPCETYVVAPGDTLSGIAQRTGWTGQRSGDLLEANRDVLRSADVLAVGTVIRIPCQPGVDFVPALEEPEAPPLDGAPLWRANAGEGLVQVLIRWGQEAGFDVIVEKGGDWRFGVPFHHSGSFRGAVDEVLSGFSTAAVAPHVTFYTNNVMTIGAR
jgi:hypothetical protein